MQKMKDDNPQRRRDDVALHKRDLDNIAINVKSRKLLKKLLMEKDLIDEYIVSIIPIILGDGKRLFLGGVDQIKLKSMGVKEFESGLVQLRYERNIK